MYPAPPHIRTDLFQLGLGQQPKHKSHCITGKLRVNGGHSWTLPLVHGPILLLQCASNQNHIRTVCMHSKCEPHKSPPHLALPATVVVELALWAAKWLHSVAQQHRVRACLICHAYSINMLAIYSSFSNSLFPSYTVALWVKCERSAIVRISTCWPASHGIKLHVHQKLITLGLPAARAGYTTFTSQEVAQSRNVPSQLGEAGRTISTVCCWPDWVTERLTLQRMETLWCIRQWNSACTPGLSCNRCQVSHFV